MDSMDRDAKGQWTQWTGTQWTGDAKGQWTQWTGGPMDNEETGDCAFTQKF